LLNLKAPIYLDESSLALVEEIILEDGASMNDIQAMMMDNSSTHHHRQFVRLWCLCSWPGRWLHLRHV